jgi:hypothetical protein
VARAVWQGSLAAYNRALRQFELIAKLVIELSISGLIIGLIYRYWRGWDSGSGGYLDE